MEIAKLGFLGGGTEALEGFQGGITRGYSLQMMSVAGGGT